MKRTFRLLCAPPAPVLEGLRLDVDAIARVLGSDAYTTRQRLVGTGVRALSRSDIEASMQARAEALRALGLKATVFESDRRRAPVRVCAVEPVDAGLVLRGSNAEIVGEMARGARVLVVALSIPSPHEVLRERPLPVDLPPEAALDLLDEAGHWFRIRLAGFLYNRYEGLGMSSLVAQVGRLFASLQACGELTLHLGYPPNFGRPADSDEVREYSLRVHALWRAGLLTPDSAAGSESLAEVASPTRVEMGRDPASVLPLRRRPLRALRAVRGVNDVTVGLGIAFGIIAVGGLLLLARHAPGTGRLLVGAGLLVGAAGALFRAQRALSRWQQVSDTPGARARFVAQGLAEFSGPVECDEPFLAPYSRRPCVWYDVRVERQKRDLTSVARDRLPWVLHVLRRTDIDAAPTHGYVVQVEGDSGDRPFRLRDETGLILVEPVGAEWHGCEAESHRLNVRGERWRITERLLPMGSVIYVLGRVERGEHPEDSPHPTATLAGTVARVRRGADGLLLLSDRGPTWLRRKLWHQTLAGGALGLIAALIGLALMLGGGGA